MYILTSENVIFCMLLRALYWAVSVGDVVEIYYGVGTIDVQKYPAVIDKVYNIKVIYSSTKAETTNKLGYGNKINNDN